MAPNTAARLAVRLLQLHAGCINFFFEVDTADNASLLAEELTALGCAVLFDVNDFRLNIYPPTHGASDGHVVRDLGRAYVRRGLQST